MLLRFQMLTANCSTWSWTRTKKGGSLITQTEKKSEMSQRLVKIETAKWTHDTMTIEITGGHWKYNEGRVQRGGRGKLLLCLLNEKQQNEMRPPRKLQINIQYNMHESAREPE